MKIAHSGGESSIPSSLIGEGDESLLCDTESEQPNLIRRYTKVLDKKI